MDNLISAKKMYANLINFLAASKEAVSRREKKIILIMLRQAQNEGVLLSEFYTENIGAFQELGITLDDVGEIGYIY